MTLPGIFAVLAIMSLVLTVWQWLAARRFPLHRRVANPQSRISRPDCLSDDPSACSTVTSEPVGNRLEALSHHVLPPVTLLKPLNGSDEHTEACLRSWFVQDYAGKIQILLGVPGAGDSASGIAKKLLAEFPERDAQCVVCNEQLGANAKVSKLAQLEPLAKHEIIVISDADVCVPTDLLVNVVATLHRADTGSAGIPAGLGQSEKHAGRDGDAPSVGLVNCFYRLANATTLAMQWEAIAINADFWSQVLQSASFRKLNFALGAVMATRRRQLSEIGGFKALVDYLADDYQLGHRITQRGYRIELCPVVAECWSPPMNWRDVWRHQLRWARTIRVCEPVPYFFSILNNVTLWSLAWVVVGFLAPAGSDTFVPGSFVASFEFRWAYAGAALCLLTRVAVALNLQNCLSPARAHWKYFWLVPAKDLLQFAVWAGAFLGNHIEWRGCRYRLRRDGTLVPR